MNDQPNNLARPLVLASGSPRRRELLAEAGFTFIVDPPTIEEPTELSENITPAEYAEALAYYKAYSVATAHPEAIVIGADTIVALGDQILGKPDNEAHARQILHDLSHNRHAVITGLAILCPDGERIITSDTTWITMNPMSPQQIDEYIATGEWKGKAGAYGIQGQADRYVKHVDGSFTNVVGLPMELLSELLNNLISPLPAN